MSNFEDVKKFMKTFGQKVITTPQFPDEKTMSLRFDRGTNDFLIIDVPGSTTAGTPTTPTKNVNKQGLFITTAPHSIGTDNPFQVDLEIMFRSLSIWIRDNEPLYP